VRSLENVTRRTLWTVKVYKSNKISAYCGSELNANDFMIGTNLSRAAISDPFYEVIETSPLIGNGCQDKASCNLHGDCNYCYNTCDCEYGYGKSNEVFDYVKIDCGERVCPSGNSVRDLPTAWNTAHKLAECSDNGFCDRAVGHCYCFEGWEGLSCERRVCPKDCSGHGICANMNEQTMMSNAMPLSASGNLYGSGDEARATTAWDWDSMYGCVCDSRWRVGLGRGEWQKAEWFNADCSYRRCPAGDDPTTAANETDCEGVTAEGGFGVGEAGNGCFVECSNRGVCLYESGIGSCKCQDGFLGENCGTRSGYGGKFGVWDNPADVA
jgi:hypothetical protein